MDFETNFEEDPAAEFLQREQSALAGLEVDDFASENQLIDSVVKPESPTESFEMIPGNNREDTENPARVEPEKIKKWREEQKLRLQEKDEQEELRKQELKQQAKAELADWLKQTEEAIAKTKAASRNAEKEEIFEDDSEKSNDWEKIAKLCEFNPKTSKSGKDVSRMRSIILQLKQNPIVVKTN